MSKTYTQTVAEYKGIATNLEFGKSDYTIAYFGIK
jgi:hypothetical protein